MEQINSHLSPKELNKHDQQMAEIKDGLGNERDADSAFLEMYDIPGSGPVTSTRLERYRNDKRQYDEQIFQLAQSSPLNIERVADTERADRIKDALQSDNIYLQVDAANMIGLVPEGEQEELIGIVADIAESHLRSGNDSVALKALEMIGALPKSFWADLVLEALRTDNPAVQISTLQLIHGKIEDSPELLQPGMIDCALQSPHQSVRIISAEMIQYLPEEEQEVLEEQAGVSIKEALESDDDSIRTQAAGSIWAAPELERSNLIKLALSSNLAHIQAEAEGAIWSAPDSEQPELEEKVREIIEHYIETGDIAAQADLAKIVWRRSGPEWTSLKNSLERNVETAIRNNNPAIEGKITQIIKNAPVEKQGELVQLITGTHSVNSLVASSLYQGNNNLTKSFMSRAHFAKTGSETILLGGNLRGKVIVHKIDPVSFTTWEHLYEDYQLWRDNDFDYVPIEPILSFRPNSQDTVDVSSGVLDMNLADYLSAGWGKYKNELELDRQRIIEVLLEAGVSHGHPHLGNFCLRFHRDHNGVVDLEQKPRLYMIDFDRATTELEQTNDGDTSTEPAEKILEAEEREAVEERPYDERYLREVVRKVDLLRSSTEGQAFLWAISRPGACTHFFLRNRENFHKALRDLKEGRPLVMDEALAPYRQQGNGYNEEYLSLHPANGAGVSTAIFSQSYGLFADFYRNQSGFVLKPEYFAKLADFTDDDLRLSRESIKTKHGSAGLYETRALAKSIENGTPMKFALVNSEVIDPDYGIRNATIIDGEVQEVPIMPDDVEFLFQITDSNEGLYCQFYSPQKKGWLSPSEVSELAQHCQDERIWEKYYDTRNIGPRPRTVEEMQAETRRIIEQYGIRPNGSGKEDATSNNQE